MCRGPWWIEQWRKEGSDGMCVARVCGHGADRREAQLTQQCFWSRRAARETCVQSAVSGARRAFPACCTLGYVFHVTTATVFCPWLCTPCASRKRLEATSLSRVTSQVCNLQRWPFKATSGTHARPVSSLKLCRSRHISRPKLPAQASAGGLRRDPARLRRSPPGLLLQRPPAAPPPPPQPLLLRCLTGGVRVVACGAHGERPPPRRRLTSSRSAARASRRLGRSGGRARCLQEGSEKVRTNFSPAHVALLGGGRCRTPPVDHRSAPPPLLWLSQAPVHGGRV